MRRTWRQRRMSLRMIEPEPSGRRWEHSPVTTRANARRKAANSRASIAMCTVGGWRRCIWRCGVVPPCTELLLLGAAR